MGVSAPLASAQEECEEGGTYPPAFCEEDGPVDGGDSDDGDDDDDDGDPGDEDEDDGPRLTVSRAVVRAGDTVTLTAIDGCLPGSPVTVGLLNVRDGGQPRTLATLTADASGGFLGTVTVPSGSRPGVYVLFVSCRLDQGSDRTTISTVPFVINATGRTPSAGLGGPVSSSSRSGGDARAAAAELERAGVRLADVPATWTPSPAWAVSVEERQRLVEAVDLRLAALRTELAVPGTVASAAAPAPTDLTPWYVAGGVSFVLLGAAGYRRRSSTVRTGVEGESA